MSRNEQEDKMKNNLYIRIMGRNIPISAMFDNEKDANKHMAHTNDGVIATFGKYILLANMETK